jgi:hypothetical protein
MMDMFVLHPANQPVAKGLQPYRDVKSGRLAKAIGLPILLVFPLFGLFLFAMIVPTTLRNWSEEQRLNSANQPTTGVIEDLEEDKDNNESSYFVTYRYQVTLANGETGSFQRKEPVSPELYQPLNRGATVAVRYLAEDPSVARLANNLNYSPISAVLILGFLLIWAVAFCGLPLYLAWRMIKTWRNERRLAQDGHLIMGEVTAFDGRVDDDNDYLINLRYQFLSPLGGRIEGVVSGIHNQIKGSVLSVGTPVAIWYLDDQRYTLL